MNYPAETSTMCFRPIDGLVASVLYLLLDCTWFRLQSDKVYFILAAGHDVSFLFVQDLLSVGQHQMSDRDVISSYLQSVVNRAGQCGLGVHA